MSKSTKTMRIIGLILTLAMLIASLPMAYAENNSDYMLYHAEFDSASAPEISDFWGYISESDKFAVTSSKWQDGGYITEYSNSNHYRFLLDKDYSANITTDSVVVWEARIKHAKNNGGVNADGNIASNFNIFAAGTADENNGLRIYGKDGYFSYSVVNGVKPSGKMTDYRLKADTFYTYKIKYIPQTKKAKFMVSNETQGTYESDWVSCGSMGTITYQYATLCGSLYFYKTTADYLRIYDEAKLPKAAIAESDLTNLKNGDTLTVNLGAEITEDILAENPITVDGNAKVTSVLSEDGKTITLTLSNITALKHYTLTIPDLGMNIGLTANIRGADADYMLYRAEFDSASDPEINDFWEYISESDKFAVTSSKWQDGGYITEYSNSNHYRFLLDKDYSANITTDSVVVWEARIKHAKNNGGVNADGNIASNFNIFAAGTADENNGLRIYGKDGYFSYSVVNGVKPSGKMTDYRLKADTFYTYKIKYIPQTKKAKFMVSNEEQGSYESDWVSCGSMGSMNYKNAMLSGSLYWYRTTADYLRIYDESLVPLPTVTGDDLMNVKNGDKLTVTFPFAVTNAELEENPITILGGASVFASLASDGMSAEVTLSNISARTKYTVNIPELGQNKGLSVNLRGADEAKYYYRAEFDGNDDTAKLYTDDINGTQYNSAEQFISDGMAHTRAGGWNRLCIMFDKMNKTDPDSIFKNGIVPNSPINVTGKENVVFETKLKFTAGKIFSKFMTIGQNLVTIGYNDGLMYSTDYIRPNKYFMVNDEQYRISPDVWYTIQIRMNFVTNRYSISVVDQNGDFATSGSIGYINNYSDGTIEGITFPAMYGNGYADLYVDYARLWDDDYGSVTVTYDKNGKAVPLADSVLVTGSEEFSFDRIGSGGNVSDITAKTEDGTNLNVAALDNGSRVTFGITDTIPSDTKVSVTIPKEINGAEKDQTISFRTKWDTTVTDFVKPEMFKDKTGLEVVFFGGSITYQEYWRGTVTNKIKEWFPDSNCYNSSRGGTGSKYGWTRLENDVKKYNPDVVFVEYAVNDANDANTAQYMESIVRTVNTWDKVPVVIFVYTTSIDFKANAYAVSEQTRVAESYGVPYISVRDYCMSMYNADNYFKADWDNKVYLPDNTHTSQAGGKLYGDYVNALLLSNPNKYFKLPKKNSEVSKLSENAKEYMLAYTPDIKTLNSDNTSETIEFVGNELVLEVYRTAQSGNLKLAVDGREIADYALYSSTVMPSNTFLYYDGFGNGKHTAVISVGGAGTEGGNDINLKGYYQKPFASEFYAPVFSANTITAGTPIEVTFGYITPAAEEVTFFVVSYKANGAVNQIVPVTSELQASEEKQTSKITFTPNENDVKISAFAWESYSTMKPKCESAYIAK